MAGGGVRRPAVMRLELEAVEHGRVVAGGDHHAAHRALGLTAKETEGVGVGSGVKTTWKPLPAKTSAARRRKAVGKEAAVITYDHLLFSAGGWVRGPIIRRGLGDALDVGEGKILGDHCAPAVGSELDAWGHLGVLSKEMRVEG